MTVLSRCRVPDGFLKTFYHAFCLCHSRDIPCADNGLFCPHFTQKHQFLPVEKLFCLRLTDTRLSYFSWYSLFPSNTGPFMLLKTQPWAPPLFSLHHLTMYHGNSLHFNCMSELILNFISPGDNSAPISTCKLTYIQKMKTYPIIRNWKQVSPMSFSNHTSFLPPQSSHYPDLYGNSFIDFYFNFTVHEWIPIYFDFTQGFFER